MPPNLGGFFMVRSYYPSECHMTHVFFCVSKNVSVSCAYTQGKREQFSGFNRTLDAINNVFRKFSAFHDETGRLNVDGMNIISNDGSNKLNRSSLKATSYMAVGFYVAKYVNKKSDMDLAAKGLGAKEWNNSLKTKLSLLPKKLFRIRMSRNFGMKM